MLLAGKARGTARRRTKPRQELRDAGMGHTVDLGDYRRSRRTVYFERHELGRLLSFYSTRVARGEWRDYAIDHRPGMAMFSVFRSAHEVPLYSIVKLPPAGKKPTSYALFAGRQKLKQSESLEDVLAQVPKALMLVGG